MKFKLILIILFTFHISSFAQMRDQTLKIAEDHMKEGEFELARQQYEVLTDLDETDGDAWLGKGLANDNLKDYNEALNCYQTADKHLKTSPFPSYYAGIIHDRKKNYRSAMEAFSYSLEKDTVLPGIYFLIGKSMFHLENSYGAKDYLYKHLKSDPDHGYASFYLSKIYLESEEFDSAKVYIQKALVSEVIPPRFNLQDGDIHYSQGEWSAAMLSYSAALKTNPNYQNARISRAVAYKNMEAYGLAIEDFKIALKKDENDPFMLFDLGYCQSKVGNYSEAQKTFKKLEQNDPKNISVKEALLELSFLTEDYSDAIELANELIRLNPAEDNYFYEKGNAYQYKGESQLAFDAYDYCVSMNPKNEAAWFNKAVVAYELERQEQACHIWKQMITKAVDPFYKDQAEVKVLEYCN